MNYKRLLIISHNCLSKTGSNGRTLANLLEGWPKQKVRQFYIHPEQPCFDICDQYYCITDMAILKSVLNRTDAGWVVKPQKRDTESKAGTIGPKKKKRLKNSFFFWCRETIWKSHLWKCAQLEKWIAEFSPEIILVQAGDMGFLFDLAIAISQKYHAPIVVYNTEGYYFKSVSYLEENWISNLFYPGLHKSFMKSYENLISSSKMEIYNCDLLRDDYYAVFHTDSRVIMNSSDFTEEEVYNSKKRKFVYAGNLGVDRHKSLITFAEALQKVEPNLVVEVYGKAPNEAVKKELESCAGIRMQGFVPYNELKKILRESKYLLHVESFEDFYREDLKYAFSTKIADSLAVGACLFVYAPENMAVVQYLQGKEAAVLISKPELLEEKIAEILHNEGQSKIYAENGRKLAQKNHNFRKNQEEFKKILLK